MRSARHRCPFYILNEVELPPYEGERLGPVGGRIMTEVLVELLQRDPNSYLYLDPAWKPAPPIAPATGQIHLRRPAAIRRCYLIANPPYASRAPRVGLRGPRARWEIGRLKAPRLGH